MIDFRRKGPRAAILALALALILTLVSCAYGAGSAVPTGERMDLLSMELSALEEYVEIGQYKELDIALDGRSRGEAVWAAVAEGSEMKLYPEDQVYYYVEQIRAEYRYHAQKSGMSYEDMLEQLGVDEGDILREAKELTKGDLLYAVVQKRESIALTEEEKQTLFDRYVDKYVSEYGYTEEYVSENLSDEIYGSMLYDKTTEFLIVNNSFS